MRWGKSVALLLGCVLLVWLRAAHAEPVPHAMQAASGSEPAEPRHILVLGDSLSAEYGLPRGSGWVHHIERRLQARDQAYQIRNASISGDTTIGGLQRLPQVLREFRPGIVILQLGANDGLRGLPLRDMRANLRNMIELSRTQGAEVLLVGQHIPPNYGPRYTREFHEVFSTLADETGSALVPFMLEGIATDSDMFLPDGLHPTAAAQAHIADTIWVHLEPMLK